MIHAAKIHLFFDIRKFFEKGIDFMYLLALRAEIQTIQTTFDDNHSLDSVYTRNITIPTTLLIDSIGIV